MSFFREILTIVAIALVALLSAALVGPWFVDWNGQRARIESLLSEASGLDVAVSGDIDVKLLPTPHLYLQGVTAKARRSGGGAEQVLGTADVIRLELAVAPLVRGAMRFTDASLGHPRVTLVLEKDGSLRLPRLPVRMSGDVAFERASLTDGELTLSRPGQAPLTIDGIALDAESPALAGPYKGQGRLHAAGQDITLRFATGVQEDDRLRVKIVIDETGSLPRTELEGAVVASSSATGSIRFAFDGAGTLSGRLALADGFDAGWRATGPARIDLDGAQMEPLEFRLGPDDRTLAATGSARLVAGPNPALSVKLTAPQIDFDRLASETRDAASGMALAKAIAGNLAARSAAIDGPSALAGLAVDVDMSAPALSLGGEVLSEPKVKASRKPGAPWQIALSTGLPGQARVKLSGVIESGPAARFTGRGEAGMRDPARLAEWLARASPELAARVATSPFRVFDVDGAVELSAVAIVGRELTIQADRSTLNGSVIFTNAVAGERARLFADLRSAALDLDGLPDLSSPAQAAADFDLNLALDARAVRIARFGAGMVDAGRIRAKLTRDGNALVLENIAIENLGGASLTARGESKPDGARIEARLDADRLVDLAALARRIAPGALADAFVQRAVALSPARITLSAEAPRLEAGAISSLKLDGTARGTRIAGVVKPDASPTSDVSAQFVFENPDAHMLLRQAGFETVALSRFGAGRLELQAQGNAQKGFTAKASGILAGTSLSYDGTVTPRNSVLDAGGRLRIASANLAPLMQILALTLPDVGAAMPVDVSGTFAMAASGSSFSDITGNIGGSKISGRLAKPVGAARVEGGLDIDSLSLASLAALVLGPRQPAKAGQRWADLKFQPAMIDAPLSRIAVRAGAFDLGGISGSNARLQLGLEPGAVRIEDLHLDVAGGNLTGGVTIRRDRDQASIAGKIRLDAPLVGRMEMTGKATAEFDFAGSGTSENALAAGLAGRGRLRLDDLKITRADPGALNRVVVAAEREQLAVEQSKIAAALQSELAAGDFKAGTVALEGSIASGALRLQSEPFAAGNDVQAQLGMSLDLRSFATESGLDLTSLRPPKDWSGTPPRLRVVWRQADGKTDRTLEIASLVNGLSARAIEREAARVAALEADIRERAFFNRRLRAQEFLRRRDAEIAAYQAEQARLAEEEVKRQAAEAARLEREKAEREKLEQRERAEAERRAQEARRASEPGRDSSGAPLEVVPRPPVRPPTVAPPPRAPVVVTPPRRDPSPSGIY
ncbi:AsmA family protein [Roseiarcaceae bacterium H3SJ34-1]|uniref:AsmA family protein n=1 Tax=Terripilifer ovatus TaxID=3032367 RepID=UPI003AB96304|nr:AsmA family protein [Roseiarcaceae bacterium H3SJ34-1]